MTIYAPTKLQSSSTYSSSTDDVLSDAYHSNITAASLLIAACIWNSDTQTCTVASSNNGSWSAIGSPQRATGNLAGYSIQLFYKLNATAGADTVTMTCSGDNAYRAIAIHEYDQIDSASALEASIYSGNVSASSDVITTASGITTTNDLDLLFCAAMVDNAVTAQGARFTLDENPSFGSNGTEHAIRFNTGTYTASFATTGTSDASMILVAFKQTAPTLGTPNNFVIMQPCNGGNAVHTAAENTEWSDFQQELIEIDSLIMYGNRVCYFEAVAKTSASFSNNIRLYFSVESGIDEGLAKDISGIEIPTGTTSYTLFRSQYFTLPAGDKIDFYPKISAAPGGTTSMCAWRICIIQGTGNIGLRSTETQIEIGNYEIEKTNTTAQPLDNPKYWKYDSSHWDGNSRFFLELAFYGDGGNVYVILQEDDGNFNWSNFQTIWNDVLSGYSFYIPTFSTPPTNGRHYRIVTYGEAGHSYNIYSCKVVIGTYEGSTTFEPGTYNVAYDVKGGTAGSGETSQAKAQEVVISKPHHVTGVKLSLKKTGSPADNLVVDLVDSLTGASLAQGTLDASTLTTSWQAKDITFGAHYDIDVGMTYYVRLTRSGARDASNYVSAEGQSAFDDNLGQAWNRDNNAWATVNYDICYQLLSDAGITKIETVMTVLNTGDGGTGLQNMPIKYLSTEWSNVTHSLRYAHDAINANDASKLVALPSTDITNANVTGANEQIAGSEFSWPASGTQIDVNVTDSTGQVNHGKIIDFITLGEEEGECTVEVVTQVITQVTTNTVIGMY